MQHTTPYICSTLSGMNTQNFIKIGLTFFTSILLLTVSACSTSSPKQTAHSSSAVVAVKYAKAQIGVPYKYGGNNPGSGFDCSGLVQYSYKQAGIRLPRSTQQLYQATRRIDKDELRPGDLVFFKINRRKVSHVGIYLGNNRFVHAPSSGKKVEITNLEKGYWKKRFSRGGRI